MSNGGLLRYITDLWQLPDVVTDPPSPHPLQKGAYICLASSLLPAHLLKKLREYLGTKLPSMHATPMGDREEETPVRSYMQGFYGSFS